MSKTNDLKARIQGKKTAAEAFIETGLLNNQKEENQQTVNNDVYVENDIDTLDLTALRQKVKQQSSKEKNICFEDKHRKLTVWVKNDAFEALQLLAANKKGEKTRIVTEALMKYASEYLKK